MRVQAVSGAGSIVFLAFLLTTTILLAVCFYRLLRRRPSKPALRALLLVALAYTAILLAMSLTSRTRYIPLGADKCFDDWCVTVLSARSLAPPGQGAGTKLLEVTLAVSNHAQRAAFRPSQPRVALVLPSGDVIAPSAAVSDALERPGAPQGNLAKRVTPGETFHTSLGFEVPASTREASVVIQEGPESITQFLVGDENSFFHKKSVFTIRVN